MQMLETMRTSMIFITRTHDEERERKRSRGFADLLNLSGEEWLRLFASELNISAFSGWCNQCRGGQLSGVECLSCHIPVVKLNSEFWQKVGEKIRRALPKNKTLLRDVKATWETLYGERRQPQFPAELQWLAHAWTDAGNPPHHPFDPKLHYEVANWVRALQAGGLSQEEIIDVMDGGFEDDQREGPIMNGKKDYANIPIQELRTLRHKFQDVMGCIPGSLLNRSEMYRTLEWVDRQRANPMARLRGERVRE
jgi:hypothetical protein